jgi:hypothetical protein
MIRLVLCAVLLLLPVACWAGDHKGCGCQRHAAVVDSNCGCCCAERVANCVVTSCKRACSTVEIQRTDCLGVPYTDEGCWKIDPNCCPRDDFRLVCPARDEFRLLCRNKCEPCNKKPKCRQDVCSSCEESGPVEE